VNSIALTTRVVDSASSELGDAFQIQEEDIDSTFCDAMDQTSRYIPTANECPSPVVDESGVYTSQRIHSSPRLIIIPDASGYQCCSLEEVEMLAPSRSFSVVMAVQFVLILTAIALSMYDYFYPRS
jgi:hypothetical protein